MNLSEAPISSDVWRFMFREDGRCIIGHCPAWNARIFDNEEVWYASERDATNAAILNMEESCARLRLVLATLPIAKSEAPKSFRFVVNPQSPYVS